MITAQDQQQWGYLLDPCFQIVNTAGKPVTNGYIEVYMAGTRVKYYCASDFNGTLHPFQIPLDSLGSNIVLADPANSYDVYVYNAFGTLLMSRYNVKVSAATSNGGGSAPVTSATVPAMFLGEYGVRVPVLEDQTGLPLPLPKGDNNTYTHNADEIIDHYDSEGLYMYLKPGVFFVNATIRFRQSRDNIKNKVTNVKIFTGNGNWNEVNCNKLDCTGQHADDDYNYIHCTFIRVNDSEDTDFGRFSSGILYFRPLVYDSSWDECCIQRLEIVKLNTIGGEGGQSYIPGDYVSIVGNVISVTGVLPESATGDFVQYEEFNTEIQNIHNLEITVQNATAQIVEQTTELVTAIDAINTDLAGKKDKQTQKSFTGSQTKTITSITQNQQGVISVTYEDIDLPPEVPNVEITSPNGTIDVQSSTDVQTNTKTFTIDVKKGDVDYYIGSKSVVEVGTTNYNITNNLVRTEGNIDITQPGKGLYLVCVNANVRPSTTVNEQHEIWLSIGPNNTYTMMHSLDWTKLQDTDISCASIAKINGYEPIQIIMSYGSTPSVGVDLTICNVSVYRLDSIIGQGGGTTYTAGDGIDITNDVISTDIAVQNADKVNINLDFGNTIQTVNSITTDGSTVRTDGFNFTLPTIKAGDGIEFTKVGTETTISMDSEVGDVVETVEKLSKDIDSKLTVNFDMAQIVSRYDFGDSNITGLSNGATMLYQAFTVPINNNIRIISADEEEPTLLGIYATQNYSGKIMLALYQYDFESGYTQYVGDTGPVNVNAGRNEYPLRHINPDITELSSDSVYYAALYLPSTHNTGLYLAGCPGYSQTFNSIPRLTMGTQNILYNNAEIDMTDATTGRLDFNDGNNNYYIGPWLYGYNESNYACPRFFLQLRNGTYNEPIVVNVPFVDIGNYTLDYSNGIPDVFGDTSTLSQSSDYYQMYQTVVPLQDVDITEITLVDGNATHNSTFWNNGSLGIYSSDFSTRIGSGVTATITDNTIATSIYSHKYVLSAPIHLTANTTYRFPAGYATNLVSRVRQYSTPVNTKTLFLMDNIYHVSEYSNYVRANNVQGTFLKIKDSNNNEYVI